MNHIARLALYALIALFISLFFIFLGSNSVTDVIRGQFFLSDLGASFFLTLLLLTYLGQLNTRLDRKYTWQEHFPARMRRQLLRGVLIPAIGVAAYMSVYLFVIAGFNMDDVPFFYTEFPISVLLIVAINMAFAAHSFYRDNRKQRQDLHKLNEQLFTLQNLGSRSSPAAEPAARIQTFIASSGSRNIPIPASEVCYFYKDGNYTQLKTFASQNYLLNHSLDELMQVLDDSAFFRVNRQFILNRKACAYFTHEENGKLELFVNPAHADEIIISQKRAPLFREWLSR